MLPVFFFSLTLSLALSDSLTHSSPLQKTRRERVRGGGERKVKKKSIVSGGCRGECQGDRKWTLFSYRGASIKVIQREMLPGWLCPSAASPWHDEISSTDPSFLPVIRCYCNILFLSGNHWWETNTVAKWTGITKTNYNQIIWLNLIIQSVEPLSWTIHDQFLFLMYWKVCYLTFY